MERALIETKSFNRKIYKTPYFTYIINSRLILSKNIKMDAELKNSILKQEQQF